MKIILKTIQIIICIYLAIFSVVKVFFITQNHLYNNDYPNISGYSIFKVEEDSLSPELKKNDYVILKKQKEYQVDDIVYTRDDKMLKINEIKNEIINIDDENTIDRIVITLIDNNDKKTNIKIEDIHAKVIYQNKIISTILKIVAHPIGILVLIILAVSLSSLSYKRY